MTYVTRPGLRPSSTKVSASFGGPARRGLPFRVIVDLIQAADFAILLLAGFAAYSYLNHIAKSAFTGEFVVATVAACVAVGYVLARGRGYKLASLASPSNVVAPLAGGIALGAATAALCLVTLRIAPAAVAAWGAVWALASFTGLLAFRLSLGVLVRSWVRSGRLDRRVAVVGVNELSETFIRRSFNQPWSRTCIVGLYTDDAAAQPTGAPEHDGRYAVRGTIDTLLLDCRLRGVDAVVIALPAESKESIRKLVFRLRNVVADIYLAPEACMLDLPPMHLEELGSTPLFPIARKPISNWRHIQKEVFDRAIAGIALIFLSPLLLLVALLVRLESPGPVMFRQMRVGFNNNPFHILKFRTMFHHLSDRSAAQQTGRNDRRVTRIGRVLRQFSIDELPQLLNVLRGDMSLVGPRPHAPGTSLGTTRVDDLLDGYAQRHRVKPGITGLAQVRGCRGQMVSQDQVARRVSFDIEYIENWSLWLDLKIIMLTFRREICSRNAF